MSHPIYLNALALRPGGSGVQTYERYLLRELPKVVQRRLTAVIQSDAAGELPPDIAPIIRPPCAGARRALQGLRSPSGAALIHGLDVDIPLRSNAPRVATFHDLSVFDVPWTGPRHRAIGERALLRHSARRSDALIAVSDFTAERIRRRFRRDATVIGLAPSPDMRVPADGDIERVQRRYRLPAEFVLHVGNIEQRKNIDRLADACRLADVPLYLAGAGRSAPSGAVNLSYVPRADLPALYRRATITAVVSLYEGYGLPAIEAAACGGLVLATRVGAIFDVLGDAAVAVPTTDVDEMTSTIRALLRDAERQDELRTRGQDAVAELSWSAVAAKTAGVYRDLGA